MKTKYWIAVIAALGIVCLGLSLWLMLPGSAAQTAQIWSEGKLVHTLDLSVDQTVTVTSAKGTNVVAVKDGHIGVVEADCPDKHCISRGMCDSGVQIVCLPNRLVIRFAEQQELDGVAG